MDQNLHVAENTLQENVIQNVQLKNAKPRKEFASQETTATAELLQTDNVILLEQNTRQVVSTKVSRFAKRDVQLTVVAITFPAEMLDMHVVKELQQTFATSMQVIK
jgi:hypothetical protein